jgi:hypothetical protein
MKQGADDRKREPLIDRYYGLLLGFFVSFSRLEIPYDVYAAHRARINEVMRELDVEGELPESHQEFADHFASIAHETIINLKACGAELADFFAFGFHALHLLAGADHDEGGGMGLMRKDFGEVIDRYGLDRAAIFHVLEPGWDGGRIDDALWTELVGRYYRLAVIAIWPLPKQPGVCFVIMPFGDPFRGYYLDFYRAILRYAGYASIRGWVGLTNEFYLALLATVISRCSVALADVSAQPGTTTPNLNVIHEIGLNMGLENGTFLIRNEHDVVLPSNFTGLPILQYEAAASEFPAAMAVVIAERLPSGPPVRSTLSSRGPKSRKGTRSLKSLTSRGPKSGKGSS